MCDIKGVLPSFLVGRLQKPEPPPVSAPRKRVTYREIEKGAHRFLAAVAATVVMAALSAGVLGHILHAVFTALIVVAAAAVPAAVGLFVWVVRRQAPDVAPWLESKPVKTAPRPLTAPQLAIESKTTAVALGVHAVPVPVPSSLQP